MSEPILVADGDTIEYIREDAGGQISWHTSTGNNAGWHLVRGEHIIAGKDIPLGLCNRLVEDRRCALVEAASAKPTPAATLPVKNKPPAIDDTTSTGETKTNTPAS